MSGSRCGLVWSGVVQEETGQTWEGGRGGAATMLQPGTHSSVCWSSRENRAVKCLRGEYNGTQGGRGQTGSFFSAKIAFLKHIGKPSDLQKA